MRTILGILSLLICTGLHAVTDFNGVWQGLLVQNGKDWSKSYVIWFEFKVEKDGKVTGWSRDEAPEADAFAVKKITGEVKGDQITFKQLLMTNSKEEYKRRWCLSYGTLSYNDSTGYLSGEWNSSDCGRTKGRIMLYRSTHELAQGQEPSTSHSWRQPMIDDIKKGRKALPIRKAELAAFQFQPIFFAHDKDSLTQEAMDYLKNAANVVESHTDLRILVVGHTDSNGTDDYNMDLSRRRANNVKAFLEQCGMKADRVKLEFRGERDPATTNSTTEGKAQNRRVDIEFI